MENINMKLKRLVCGVGNNNADYVVEIREEIGHVDGKRKMKMVWVCPYYQTWADMVKRCYSAEYQDKFPTYKDCTVPDEWLTFSVFKSWMEGQDFKDKHLDKDLLFEGNKVYSAVTCVFVSPMVNTFVNDCGTARGEWLVGVCWNKARKKFQTNCRNPFTKKREHLGLFTCEQEAHNAWLKRKLELARLLAAEQTDERVAKALINRYSKPYVNEDLK